MSDRLTIHYPVQVPVKDTEELARQVRYDLITIQNNSQRIFDGLADMPFLDNPTFLEEVDIATSETLIEHKLNRTVRGWYVMRKNGLGDVYDTIDTTTSDLTKYLPLKSSVAVTVSLLIF